MKIKTSRVEREGRFKPLPKAGNGVQLLLIQSVDHLGKQGDVVTVKRGYALNYLRRRGWRLSPRTITSGYREASGPPE
jgi:large subunit ribosomal protein L9